MGTFGAGGFDNDDALDWVWKLDHAPDTRLLSEALVRVTEGDGCQDDIACRTAIAAAEVVAALRGKPTLDLPAEVSAYVKRVGAPPSEALVAQALQAVDRVRTTSGLRDLWGDSARWLDSVTKLKVRLR